MIVQQKNKNAPVPSDTEGATQTADAANATDDEEVPDVTERDWQWKQWTPSDLTAYYPDGRTEVEAGGWDHDHCLECHATLSDKGNGLRAAYYDKSCDDWLCPTCYEALIVPLQSSIVEKPPINKEAEGQ